MCSNRRSRPRTQCGTPQWPAWCAITAAMIVAGAATRVDAAGPVGAEAAVSGLEAASEVFRDEFRGAALAAHWQVVQPDSESFRVADGALRVVSHASGGLYEADLANLFRLVGQMPGGDWTVTTKVRFGLDTGAENFFIILQRDRDHWVGAQIRSFPNKYTGHRLMLGIVEGDGGRIRGHELPLVAIECNVCDSAWSWTEFSRKLIDDREVVIRIEKRGRTYAVSGRVGDDPEAPWVAVEALQSRYDEGRLALGFAQSRLPDVRQGAIPGGVSRAAIESVTIETQTAQAVIAADPSGGR